MGISEGINRRWRAAAEGRRRARWYFLCYFASIGLMVLGMTDGRFFIVGLLAMPYSLFGMIYSDPTSLKSRGVWYFFLFFGIVVDLLFMILECGDKQGFQKGDAIMLTALTIIASAQVHLLLGARKHVFGPRVVSSTERVT